MDRCINYDRNQFNDQQMEKLWQRQVEEGWGVKLQGQTLFKYHFGEEGIKAMTIINLTVESSFSGNARGFHRMAIDDSQAVKELVRNFCDAKGVNVNPTYAIINRSNLVLDGDKPLSYYGLKNDESLLLGNISDESKTFRFGHWFTLAGLGFLFGILGITICTVLFAVLRTVPENYAIVVDAGSTHSDVILYKWPGEKVNNTGEVEQVDSCYVTGGIADITPSNVSNYFDACFSQAQNLIPSNSLPNAEVLLGATAGMRLLNSSNPLKAAVTVNNIKTYLDTKQFIVKDSNIGIISGSTEGISGWITINFLKDTIYSKAGNYSSSWGALDLGGASTQITFEVSETEVNNSHVSSLNLFGHRFHVFSESYLCYGVVQSFTRYRALLLQENNNNGSIKSPCEPLGSKVTVNASDFNIPCLKANNNFKSLLIKQTYLFEGSGDTEGCRNNVSNLLNSELCQRSGWVHCMDSSYIPQNASTTKFMGFSSYAYAAKALFLNETTTKQAYLKELEHLCTSTYQSLVERKEREGPKTVLKDVVNACFKAQLVQTLLNDIYRLNTDEKWGNIHFTTKINSTSVGWSLGYMINATDDISAGSSIPKLQPVPFALLLVLFAIFLVLSVGFVYHGIKLRKSSSYQRKISVKSDEDL